MRRRMMCVPMMILLLTLTACGGSGEGSQAEQLALEIRGEYLDMTACNATMDVTADYGQRVYDYTIEAAYVKDGETTLTVTAPEIIAGVTARLSKDSTVLEYDGVCWETGALNPDGMSPVDAIPALLAYAREGFIAECGMETVNETELLRIVCRDPEGTAGAGEECSLWFAPDTHALLRGELSQDGYTVIQCVFSQFTMT